jgi:hypothetical protein
VRGKPALGLRELRRRVGEAALSVERDQVRIPPALEASRDDVRDLAARVLRDESPRRGARDLRHPLLGVGQLGPVGAQARRVVDARFERLRMCGGAQGEDMHGPRDVLDRVLAEVVELGRDLVAHGAG